MRKNKREMILRLRLSRMKQILIPNQFLSLMMRYLLQRS
jgi:hypothetical protein